MKNKRNPQLRRAPYPYKAIFSISSDIDCTDTLKQFERIQSFMLEEIGINFSNTFFPFHDRKCFSLISGSVKDRDAIIRNIHDGSIDAIHSFGEKQDFCRQNAFEALNVLKKNNCNIRIWIDHAESISNFCKYRFQGRGDIPGCKEYHFDLLKEYGIRYIWTERLTNIIGQDIPLTSRNILGIYDRAQRIRSGTRLFKTVFKILLGQCGYRKYDFFKGNKLVFVQNLMDHNKVYEFVRFNNHFNGASVGDTFEDLYYLISENVQNQLKINNGYCIAYTHLGKKFDPNSVNGRKTKKALLNLKQESEKKNIYVVSVRWLLDYATTLKNLKWNWTRNPEETKITIKSIDDPIDCKRVPTLRELKNICFYVDGYTKIYIEDQEVTAVTHNQPDHTDQCSITIG